jgi:cell division septation protein DedD
MAASTDQSLYQELADRYESLQQPSMRDRFLLLAADAAFANGQIELAERLRTRLLRHNPDHLLRPYRSFAEARQSADVQTYLRDLRLNYPVDRAREILESMNESDESESVVLRPFAPANPSELPAAVPMNTSPTRRESLVPQTAPLLDINTPSAHPSWGPATPIPLASDTAPSTRPRAQPIPLQAPADTSQPASRKRPATSSIPVVVSQYPTTEPIHPPHATQTGAWFAVLLAGLVGMAGLLLAAYVFTRPFLPADWLP